MGAVLLPHCESFGDTERLTKDLEPDLDQLELFVCATHRIPVQQVA